MFDQFITNIKEGKHFTFSRFGDGEWSAMLHRHGKNCDGHEYFTDMGNSLSMILYNYNFQSNYYLGLQQHALRTMGDEVRGLITTFELKESTFIDADIWHKASIHGEFHKFFEAIKHKNVLLVGPHSLTKLGIHSFWAEVPELNCWKSYDVIMKNIENYINLVDIVIFSAGMPAKVMIDELYQKYGTTKTLLDMGSVFMPYVGISNRSYHKKIIERENIKVNNTIPKR